jgi:hypothetical protein
MTRFLLVGTGAVLATVAAALWFTEYEERRARARRATRKW